MNEMMTREGLPPVADFSDFIGQEALKTRLRVHIESSLVREQPMQHVLLAGPAGAGKTTLARLIAQELHDQFTKLVMPIDRRTLVRKLRFPNFAGGVLFLDEIHAMTKRDQEILLPVLSESAVVDDRGRRFALPWVTVIAATTERDKLIAPLHDRFSIKPEVAPYTDAELGLIVQGMANRIGLPLSAETAVALGLAAGGVPRNAEEFILTARDLQVTNHGVPATAAEILSLCDVEPDGLTALDLRYLRGMSDLGGRSGSKNMAGYLGVSETTLRSRELFLASRDLIEFSQAGKELTPMGDARLGSYVETEYKRR